MKQPFEKILKHKEMIDGVFSRNKFGTSYVSLV